MPFILPDDDTGRPRRSQPRSPPGTRQQLWRRSMTAGAEPNLMPC